MFNNLKYVSCDSFESVFELINDSTKKNCIIAGGTDVITGIRNESNRFKNIDYIIDLKKIKQVHQIVENEKEYLVGAFVTFTEITDYFEGKKEFKLLTDAINRIGNLQVRNRATIGGNIVNCAPCADSVPPLLVYNATVILVSSLGEREIQLSDFLVSPYKTTLKENEFLAYIKIPKEEKEYNGNFVKLGKRRGVAISRISIAVLTKIEENRFVDLRIASGAITPIAKRFYLIEEKYKGKETSSEMIKQLVGDVAKEVLGQTGIRWSYPYKLPVFQQLLYSEIKKLTL